MGTAFLAPFVGYPIHLLRSPGSAARPAVRPRPAASLADFDKNGITGTITFDPQNPAATTGKIVIASESLTVANPLQKEHLHGPNWLDVAKYPEISFEAKSLANVKTDGNTTTADVTGTFSLHGVSEDITVPVKFTYLADKLSARVPSLKGDLLVIRANFSINREDFNIEKGQYEDKVANEIDLNLSIAGAAVKP